LHSSPVFLVNLRELAILMFFCLTMVQGSADAMLFLQLLDVTDTLQLRPLNVTSIQHLDASLAQI
jgi:hypothetical protein